MATEPEPTLWAVEPGKRVRVWKELLGVEAEDPRLVNSRIAGVKQDLPNQRVIHLDVARTRGAVEAVKALGEDGTLEQVLTYYVRNRAVQYKQGLNEVLAPLVVAASQPVPATLLALMDRIVAAFMARVYAADDEFVALQSSLHYARLLLQYFDAPVSRCLEQHECSMELFATGWLLTAFARGTPLDLVLHLWDWLFWHAAGRAPDGVARVPHEYSTLKHSAGAAPDASEPGSPAAFGAGLWASGQAMGAALPQVAAGFAWRDSAPCPVGPEILHWLVVARIIDARDEILGCVASGEKFAGADLPLVLTKLRWIDRAHIERCCCLALDLYHSTPPSFCHELYSAVYQPGGTCPPALLCRLETRVCLKVPARAVVQAALPRARAASAALPAASPASCAAPAAAAIPAAPAHTPAASARQRWACSDEAWAAAPKLPSLVLDCRPAECWVTEGHLPTAFHFPPEALYSVNGLQRLVLGLAEACGSRLALLEDREQRTPPAGTSAHALHLMILGEGRRNVLYGVEPELGEVPNGSRVATGQHSSSAPGKPSWRAAMRQAVKRRAQRRRQKRITHGAAADSDAVDYSDSDVTKAVIMLLLQRGFEHVSEVQGGFQALAQELGELREEHLIFTPAVDWEDSEEDSEHGELGGTAGQPRPEPAQSDPLHAAQVLRAGSDGACGLFAGVHTEEMAREEHEYDTQLDAAVHALRCEDAGHGDVAV